jgi:hypothetical protein
MPTDDKPDNTPHPRKQMPPSESKSWKDQTISIPVGVLLLGGGVGLGGAGTGFMGHDYGKEIAEVRFQLHDVQQELHATNDKLNELSSLIDRAFPRTLPANRGEK